MLNLIQIHLRTHRFFLLAWLIPLVLLAATSPGTYISSYPDEGSLAAVGASMRGTLGPVVLYGTIPEPFNYATWTSWKTVSWLIILAAIMNILLGSSVSRGLEESGQAELLQSNGLSAGVLRRAALTVTILTSVLWGVLVVVSLWANSALSDQFTLKGSLIDGGVSLMSVGFFGLLAILAGEAFGSVRAARQASLLVLLVSFGVRIVADVYHQHWLRWLTPVGWFEVVKPYEHDGDRWALLLVFALVLVLMALPIVGATPTSQIPGRRLGPMVALVATPRPHGRLVGGRHCGGLHWTVCHDRGNVGHFHGIPRHLGAFQPNRPKHPGSSGCVCPADGDHGGNPGLLHDRPIGVVHA